MFAPRLQQLVFHAVLSHQETNVVLSQLAEDMWILSEILLSVWKDPTSLTQEPLLKYHWIWTVQANLKTCIKDMLSYWVGLQKIGWTIDQIFSWCWFLKPAVVIYFWGYFFFFLFQNLSLQFPNNLIVKHIKYKWGLINFNVLQKKKKIKKRQDIYIYIYIYICYGKGSIKLDGLIFYLYLRGLGGTWGPLLGRMRCWNETKLTSKMYLSVMLFPICFFHDGISPSEFLYSF